MIRVVIAYFRSGGTLLNRCLASMSNLVVMSEVGPTRNDIVEQARNWYGIGLRSHEFLDAADELNALCEKQSKYLVLRLWVVGEFARGRATAPDPTYELTGFRMLKQRFGEVRTVALIRDPIDVWISRGCRPKGFFGNYRRYIENVLSERIPIEYYERFCRDPDASIRSICRTLEIPYDEGYKNFYAQSNVRGDTIYTSSRGRHADKIMVLKRRRIAKQHKDFINQSADVKAVNERLGYPTRYEGVELESRLTEVRRWLMARFRNGQAS